MKCNVCFSEMQKASNELDWISFCKQCGYLSSELSSGSGSEVVGIKSIRIKNFNKILKIISCYRSLNTIVGLEVGCNKGIFLDEAKRKGFRCIGIEPDIKAFTEAVDKGHEVYNGFFPEAALVKNDKYDLIIFNDVFEHIPDIHGAKLALNKMLTSNGLLVLNLPDSNGILYRAAKLFAILGWNEPIERLWQKGLSSPHLSYFNSNNLIDFFCNDGEYSVLYKDRLESIQIKGLWDRLRSGGQSRVLSLIIFLPLAMIAILSQFLPSDIQLLVVQKNSV